MESKRFVLTKERLCNSFVIQSDEAVAVWLCIDDTLRWTENRIQIEATFSVEVGSGERQIHLRDAVAIPTASYTRNGSAR
jgi:hypothetical protein